MIAWPGLKPSLRFHSPGSMCTPCALAGITAFVRATRRPVADVLSCLVCATLLGNGSRHPRFGVPLHVAAEAAAGSRSSAPSAPRTRGPMAWNLPLRVALDRLERWVAAALVVGRMLDPTAAGGGG